MSKSNNFYSPLIIALLSGVLMGLTVAPFNGWFLAWFALAPLWVLIFNPAYKPKLFRLQLAGTWGLGYYGATLSWITGLHPLTWMGVPWLSSIAIALFAWTFVTLWGILLAMSWVTSFFWISQKLETPFLTPTLRVLIGTTLWCILEHIWANGPLWWSSLSYTQSPHNLVILHLGQYSGASAVTASIVAINGLIAEVWIKTRNSSKYNKYYFIPLSLFIILHLIGFNLYNQPLVKPQEAAIKIGIVQGNIPNRIKFDYYGLRRAIEGYTTGYLKLVDQGVDAVLTPEGALPFFSRDILDSSLVAAVKQKGVVAWIGGFAERPNSNTYANSLFTFTKDGKIYSHFEKSKLVPLGEYVPFEEILGKLIRRLSPVTARQVPGSRNQIFDTPFGRVIAGICYESAFPGQFRRQAFSGGEFIITASNNDPYSQAMQMQHHALDTMRAIETDRWAARATNTGLSAFVDPHGKTLWISGHNTYETHAETIYRRQTQTLYTRWGDWLTPLLTILSILVLIINIKISYKNERKPN
ncbi:MAG: apolipoprotein N-acyltransferase [Calothrix sp. FI2-JRJ7]|jgi:apolipoprotein N-acyltransferase|nr:apolipoprotein N-acyltransferase [Calothrix sp. FI2-JRJ7]